jgi:hypothetical protein
MADLRLKICATNLKRIEDAPTRFTTENRDSVIATQAAIQIAQNWISAYASR